MFCFISKGLWVVRRFLVSIQNLRQCKKTTGYKFVSKKRTFGKIPHSMHNFLELQRLVNDFADFLE